jgi:protein SCO1/2
MRVRIPIKKILILVLILALPGFLYYLLTAKGKNRYFPLRIFGPKVVLHTGHKVHGKFIPDTLFHHADDFHLIDQDGKAVSYKSFNDKIIIVNFFYTHCPTICNIESGYIDSLSKGYAHNKMVSFASITVDPRRDNTAVLKAYAKKVGAIPGKWIFLTGDTAQIYNFARKGLLVNALKLNTGDFVYDDRLVLLDEERRIRGYYFGTSLTDIARLDDEIKVLIAEELRKKEPPLY